MDTRDSHSIFALYRTTDSLFSFTNTKSIFLHDSCFLNDYIWHNQELTLNKRSNFMVVKLLRIEDVVTRKLSELESNIKYT